MSERNPRIALVSARVAHSLDPDLPPLERALSAAGATVHVPDWDDPEVDWSAFDAAVLRSTWDYPTRLEEFRAWARRAAAFTRLVNPEPVVRWNTDKHYMKDLGDAGAPVIPSRFVEPGQDARPVIDEMLALSDAQEIVVKPAVGAGSVDAQRHLRTSLEDMRQHVRRLIDAGRSAMLQPFLGSVDEYGETALLYYAGQFSHAIRKGPMLKADAETEGGLYFKEHITPRTPTAEELRTGERVLAAIPSGIPVYARVDLLLNAHGAPTLLELELTEPSMFFAHAPGSADRFAKALMKACPIRR
jgi:hypothetical protein